MEDVLVLIFKPVEPLLSIMLVWWMYGYVEHLVLVRKVFTLVVLWIVHWCMKEGVLEFIYEIEVSPYFVISSHNCFHIINFIAAPRISEEPSIFYGVVNSPLTIHCVSEGSPPDTFTWRKDSRTETHYRDFKKVIHTSREAVFRSEFYIGNFQANDIGTYRCTVRNPIGSDTHAVTVRAHPNISSK